jgi:hypothetical protein
MVYKQAWSIKNYRYVETYQSPEEVAALRFIIQEQKDQMNADKRILE